MQVPFHGLNSPLPFLTQFSKNITVSCTYTFAILKTFILLCFSLKTLQKIFRLATLPAPYSAFLTFRQSILLLPFCQHVQALCFFSDRSTSIVPQPCYYCWVVYLCNHKQNQLISINLFQKTSKFSTQAHLSIN